MGVGNSSLVRYDDEEDSWVQARQRLHRQDLGRPRSDAQEGSPFRRSPFMSNSKGSKRAMMHQACVRACTPQVNYVLLVGREPFCISPASVSVPGASTPVQARSQVSAKRRGHIVVALAVTQMMMIERADARARARALLGSLEATD